MILTQSFLYIYILIQNIEIIFIYNLKYKYALHRRSYIGDCVCIKRKRVTGASFSKNLKSSSDLKHGKDNGYQGD